MSPLGRGIESEGRDVTVPVSEDEAYTSRKDKADMVDPSCCTVGFKEPLRLVVLGQERRSFG